MKLNKQTATWRQQRRLFIENLSIGMCLRACGIVKRSIFFLYSYSFSKLLEYDQHFLCLFIREKVYAVNILYARIPVKVLLFQYAISLL